MKNIGIKAFYDCDIPTIISRIDNPSEITGKTNPNRSFSNNTFNNATLYVPKGTIKKYRDTMGWQDFLYIEEVSENSTDIYSTKVKKVQVQSAGCNIIVWGAEQNTPIIVYNMFGQITGYTRASSESTIVTTSLRCGEIGVIKIGKTVLKVMIK